MRCAFSWATRPATANGCHPDPAVANTAVANTAVANTAVASTAAAIITGARITGSTTMGGNLAGGDIACAVVAPGAVRLLIGDVMGHDPRAARTAAEVTRAFRQLAAYPDPLQVVAARLHAFVADHADGEQFVTAQFVSIPNDDDADAQIVCCGHPPPLLLRAGRVTLLDALLPSPPLGLLDMGGYWPRVDLLGSRPGDSVLLYTDGVSEARDDRSRPYPLAERAAALIARVRALPAGGEHLPELLRDDLLDHVGGDLRDDATLLYLEFADEEADEEPRGA
jgi:serine phosphatase RsbU (regulator of sigma subunit)